MADKKVFDMATTVKAKDDQIETMKKEVEDARDKMEYQAVELGGLKELYDAC